jgi:hypothetical protein
MCRFLLQHGADVDHLAPPLSIMPDWRVPVNPQHLATALCQDSDGIRDGQSLESRKLLLEAGCNPLWMGPGHRGSVAVEILTSGDPVRLAAVSSVVDI